MRVNCDKDSKKSGKRWFMCDMCVFGGCVVCCCTEPEDCVVPFSISPCDWKEVDGDWVAKQWLSRGE